MLKNQFKYIKKFKCNSINDTILLAQKCSKNEIFRTMMDKPKIILLFGDVAAGKTVFSSSFIQKFMNNDKLICSSPTYTFINTYNSKNDGIGRPDNVYIHHMDLYRSDELKTLQLDHHFNQSNSLSIVEWPEKLTSDYIDRYIDNIIKIDIKKPSSKNIQNLDDLFIDSSKRLISISTNIKEYIFP